MTSLRRRGNSESDRYPEIVLVPGTYPVEDLPTGPQHQAQTQSIPNPWYNQSHLIQQGNQWLQYFLPSAQQQQQPSEDRESVEEEIDVMACRDRTSEFVNVIKSMRGRQANGVGPMRETQNGKQLHQYGDFMKIAKLIGKDISSTYTKLEKLTILAKRKSLFDDKSVEIQELTYIIKQDINSLNKQIGQLQEVGRARQKNGRHIQSHSTHVVVSLQSKLASMSNEFKKVLEVRTENLKHQKSRRDQFTQGAVSSNLPPSAVQGYHQGSVLLADEQAASSGSGEVAINVGEGVRPRGHAYQQQMQLVDEQDVYIQSRAETMQNIESTIVELGGIFQQLAHMVKEQEEMVQRIDSNVDDTHLNVEAAHGEILKYFQSVTSNRWLMIKVFGVLMFFFIVFVVFLA